MKQSDPDPIAASYPRPPERDDDIPAMFREEFMACAQSNGRISYYYLCDIFRRGRAVPEGVLTMTVARLGGIVEGHPTSRVNFLQRIDELVEKERKREI